MFDFEFHNPTKIIFGRNKENLIGQILAEAGISKILFVYGKGSIKRSGLFECITKSLEQHAIAAIKFGGVSSNPLLSHTREGVCLAKNEDVDAVLAVGGGSVLDEAKAIAVGALGDTDVWNYFTGEEVSSALPVYSVLTLAATGSEMNGNAVVTNEETQQKYNISSPLVYPQVSILNPELTYSVPPDYTAYSAVDAIAHVIEAYFTRKSAPLLQDRLVENIIATVMETTEQILQTPDSYDARAEFMWAATLALNGITTVGVEEYSFPNHMIEHSLSAMYNIPHGAGLAIVIPAFMRWFHPKNPGQFKRFATIIFGLDGAEAGIKALEQWFARIQAPTRLKDVGIPAGDIEKIAGNAVGLAKLWGIDATYDQSAIAEILKFAA